MEIHLSHLEDISKNLGIQMSTLRKYVTYFPHLFSAYATHEPNGRYMVEDIEVLKRITRLGDRISVVIPDKVNKKIPAEDKYPGHKIANVSEDLDRVFIRVSRNVDHLGE